MRSSVSSWIALVAFLVSSAAILPSSLSAQVVGSYTLTFPGNQAGCADASLNPYFCKAGGIVVNLPPGTYQVLHVAGAGDFDTGCFALTKPGPHFVCSLGGFVWDGDATTGHPISELFPCSPCGSTVFFHKGGAVVLYYHEFLCCGYDAGGSWDTLEIVLLSPEAPLQLVDPVSSLMSGSKLTSNLNVLASQGRAVAGVATDGTAQLLLRFNAPTTGTATFSLVDDNGQPLPADDENGQIHDLGATRTGNSVSVSTVSTTQGTKAFAVFIAPSQFVRNAVAADQSALGRQISIGVRFTPNGSPSYDIGTTPVCLIRPMVFLVHGVWSSLATWDDFGPLSAVDPRFYVQRADYSWISDSSFSKVAPVVYDQLKVYLNFYKQDNNVAAVQADVVTHSMGGPVVRTIALLPNYLNDPLFPTFGAGPIRKLITIAGVHQGTPLADYLVHEPCVENVFNSWPINKNPYNGAVADLTTTSAAIAAINAPDVQTPFVAHTLIGLATSQDKADVELWVNTLGSFFACWSLIHFDFDQILGQPNDLLVPQDSQTGFDIPSLATDTFSGTVHSPPFPILTSDPGETSNAKIANRVIDLLDQNMHDPSLFGRLPH